jgi:tRNA A37 methylthiotransferase MiaB
MSSIDLPKITTSRGALARYLHSSNQHVHHSLLTNMRRTTKRATSSLNGDECK